MIPGQPESKKGRRTNVERNGDEKTEKEEESSSTRSLIMCGRATGEKEREMDGEGKKHLHTGIGDRWGGSKPKEM